MSTTATSDLVCLLQNLTYENWESMLPILHDAYMDERGHEAAEAIRDVMKNNRKPAKFAESEYCWWWTQGPNESNLGPMAYAVNRFVPHTGGISDQVDEMLESFVQAWLEGHRPNQERP